MIDFSDGGIIYYTEEITDDNGEEWTRINGCVYYPKSKYTFEEAIADFQSTKSIMERANAEYRAWCD